MDGYRVPKEQAKVLLSAPPSAPEERYVFLSECAEHHQGEETLSDLLARPKRFLPFRDGGGRAVLVRKAAIEWMLIRDPERVEWVFYQNRQGVPSEAVRLEFSNGRELAGSIFAIAPEGRRRVQDLVNDAEGWLHLEAEEGLYLVNLEHVVAINGDGGEHAGA